MAAAGVVMMAISAAMAVASAAQQAKAQKMEGDYRDAEAKYNAKVGRVQAQIAEGQGNEAAAAKQRQAIELRRRGKHMTADIMMKNAAFGGGSLDTVNMEALSDKNAEFDAMTALYEGRETEIGRKFQADLLRTGASGEEAAGAYARRVSRVRASGTMLAGVSKAAGTFSGYKGGGGGSLAGQGGMAQHTAGWL